MRRSLALRLVAAALLTLAVSAPAAAWTKETHLFVARKAASIAPPDLSRLIERHEAAYRRGVLEAWADSHGNPEPVGLADAPAQDRVMQIAAATVEAIQSHRPFEDVVYRAGRLAHDLADLNNPLAVTDGDPFESRYSADYARYAESAQERFTVVFYGFEEDLERAPDLGALVDRAVSRGRELYPHIGREYRRIGGKSGLRHFDDRSTAFGVAATAVSQAVSDVAVALRYIWLEAGGVDQRPDLPLRQR